MIALMGGAKIIWNLSGRAESIISREGYRTMNNTGTLTLTIGEGPVSSKLDDYGNQRD